MWTPQTRAAGSVAQTAAARSRWGYAASVRRLRVIGIGPGGIDQITIGAIEAMNTVDVFLLLDKPNGPRDLRTQMRERYVERPHTVVVIADPPRDRTPADYTDTVAQWHRRRARLIADAINDQPADAVLGILVWGDPAIYDSTLRVVEMIEDLGVQLEVDVVAGLMSINALTAAHRQVLNSVGGAVHVTTGRNLRSSGIPAGVDAVVVMLDSHCAFLEFPAWSLFWGANLGTPDQVTRSGSVARIGAEVVRLRAELRERVGWVMDTYLLRAPEGER